MLYRALPESGVREAGKPTPVYRLKEFKYNSHYWILKFLAKAKRPLRILDVGVAGGYLGQILKQQGHHLVGIESDPRLAAEARPHYEYLYLVDVEQFDFSQRAEFDYILFADVLEHLRDPTELLRRVLPCLNSSGEIIISLPNVANLFIRLNLMLGRFEYGERGILDKTHLRFFTLATMRQMICDASCRMVELKPTSVPLQLVIPWTDSRIFWPIHELHFFAVRLWKRLLAYQFVARIVPEQNKLS